MIKHLYKHLNKNLVGKYVIKNKNVKNIFK